jgi:adenylate kinase
MRNCVYLILLGAPGSGKGTQAKRLVTEFDLVHISTGDMLRQAIAAGTDLGELIEHYIKAGYLVPDHHVTSLVDQRLAKADVNNGFILDGFPRTVRQAESLDEILRLREIVLDAVALIDVPDEIVVERMSGRRIDPQTGRIYNLGADADQPPAEILARFEKRDDDSEDVIRHRLTTFHDLTDPVVSFYEARGNLVRIDGTQAPETVFEVLTSQVQPVPKQP